MTLIEAWYRRHFCETTSWYAGNPALGTELMDIPSQNMKYIYVGKGKIWIKKDVSKLMRKLRESKRPIF